MVIQKKEPGVAAVNRALSILLAFEKSVEGMTLAEISAVTGLYHSTILRLCASLEHSLLLNLTGQRSKKNAFNREIYLAKAAYIVETASFIPKAQNSKPTQATQPAAIL